jgi:hypothetical protein
LGTEEGRREHQQLWVAAEWKFELVAGDVVIFELPWEAVEWQAGEEGEHGRQGQFVLSGCSLAQMFDGGLLALVARVLREAE